MAFTNPADVALLAHRFQPIILNTATAEELLVSRLQSYEPSIRANMETHEELGNVDPVGYTSDAPEFSVTLEENVHSSNLDLLLAGKDVQTITAWNLADYINNGVITTYLLERTNAPVTTIAGELEFTNCVVSDIVWSWRVQQAITAQYTLLGRFGNRYKAANVIHTWQAPNTSAPGGIKAKDARLFLGGATATDRVYRLQAFTLRASFRAQQVPEIGSRNLAGTVTNVPQVRLDVEFAAADPQPDSTFFSTGATKSDYANPTLLTGSAIRVYDPNAAEGATVLRAWSLENLIVGDANPVRAQVRNMATKRYSLVVPKVTTAGSAGVRLFVGDIV
ncbi:MAG: hypothetical protein HY868_25550 [Chloroflexi bacterium]|nr:hypothetical protein [Chloroflexota bacterium]